MDHCDQVIQHFPSSSAGTLQWSVLYFNGITHNSFVSENLGYWPITQYTSGSCPCYHFPSVSAACFHGSRKKKSPTSDQSSIAGLLVGQLDSFLPVFLSCALRIVVDSVRFHHSSSLVLKLFSSRHTLFIIGWFKCLHLLPHTPGRASSHPGAHNKLECGFLLDNAGTKVTYWGRGHINRIFLCITWIFDETSTTDIVFHTH